MAHLEERDGIMYCIEEDGTEWVYTPPQKESNPIEELKDHIKELKQNNETLQQDNLNLMLGLTSIYEQLLGGGQ